MIRRYFASVLIGATLIIPIESVVYAQTTQLEEIIVTARKREESLQDIPIAITAISKTDIEEAAITGLEDISSLASGFYFFNQGQNQPGRYNTQLRFRGLNQAQFSPSFETGALFIDGVYVLNGGTSLSLQDIERVEVIKGPQSAYFGRNTFGGAVNFITRDPSMEEFSGELNITATDRSRFDVTTFLEGPLIADKLSGSLSARYYDKEGHYTASDGGNLGDEQTTSVTAKLLWQASDKLSIKFRGSVSEDDDGAPAQAYIAGRLNDSCAGNPITTPVGEVANPFNFICGQVPDVNSAVPAQFSNVIDGNTVFQPGINGSGNTISQIFADSTIQGGLPALTEIGLRRESTRFSIISNYQFDNGYELDFVYGKNEQDANFIRDFDLSAFPGGFSGDPQTLSDESYELRITSPQDKRFRWSAGLNYYEQDFASSLQGGTFAFGCFSNQLFSGSTTAGCIPSPNGVGNFILGPFANSFGQSDESEVFGVFASLEYDITDQLTVTFEGRQQNDTLIKGGATGPTGIDGSAQELEFDEFLPRVILRYQPNDGTTLYASYSKGVVPGDLNTEFFNADAREREQYLAQFPGLGESTPQEELDSFEIGLKQSIFGNRGYLNLSIYSNEWTGIKGRSSVAIQETCEASDIAAAAPGCTFAGVVPGVGRLQAGPDGELGAFFNARNILLDGDADIQGFELEVGGVIRDGWTADASIAYVDTEYTRYIFNFGESRLGFSDVQGLSVPRIPDWSGNLTSTYTWNINSEMTGFVRGDLNYFGETFTDERNLAFTDSYMLADLRAGVETENYRVELFVKNLFDEDAWASGARFSDTAFAADFANFFQEQGVNVAPQNKQEFGIRATYRF